MKKQTLLALVLGIISFSILAVWAFAQETPGGTLDKESLKAAGKAAFLNNKCNLCHSLESEKIEKTSGGYQKSKEKNVPPDLSDIGREHTADWMAKYLKKTEAIDGVKHARLYRGTEEELLILSKWLESMK